MLSAIDAADAGFDVPRMDAALQRMQGDIDRGGIPGVVLLVARHGGLVMHEALGLQDPQSGTPMALDAIFRIYSMTKPITSLAVLQLAERGQLMLSDPVSQYLPAFAQLQVAHFDGDRMALHPMRQQPTIHDLLRHTAGLTYAFLDDGPMQRMYVKARLPSGALDTEGFIQALAGLPLAFQPGSTWEYSHATDVLGAVIEAVTGQRLGVFLQESICGPLGMVDTGFWTPPEKQHRLAEPAAAEVPQLPMPLLDPRKPPPMDGGGSGLMSTAMDYARLLQCLLNGGVLDGQRIASPHTVRMMTHDHVGSIPQKISQFGGQMLTPGIGFGLGFAVRLAEGLEDLPGSPGMYSWGGVCGTTFWVDPQQELVAILMSQASLRREHYRQLWRNLVYGAMER
jgi:CubicO group peptidase (beta-lactamase class C family)